MDKVTLEDGQSANIVSENIEKLKELFPDVFTEGGVNFDLLRQVLGDASVLDEGEEKYGLNWHGKKKARQIALTPSTGTLMPCPDESVDWNTTQNLFIEGDNLEVLKLLQKSYANKVKMIYIDPPYNTGGEFVYPDKFQENLETYLKYTGQVDEDGVKFSSNTEAGGRKHTNWLNMMLPRLKVAKSLLGTDGVIFISIDDHEQANLKKICDEIFGEENFIANAIWRSKDNSNNDSKKFSGDYNHTLVYSKRSDWQPAKLTDPSKQKHFKNPDNDPKGAYFDGNPLNSPNYRANLVYAISSPQGIEIQPPKNGWRWSKAAMQEKIESGEISFTEAGTGIRRRTYLKDMSGLPPSNLWIDLEKTGHNRQAKYELLKLIPDDVFDTPKPVKLVEYMMKLTKCEKDDVVLDFFAGSGTTAHAVMQYNIKENSECRCISIQLPEVCEEKSDAFKAGYENIAEIGKERIRRAAALLTEEFSGHKTDLGFKNFKLSSSSIRAWNPDRTDLEETLLTHKDHLVEGRSEQDVLYELLLKRGIELTVPIKEKQVAGKTIYSIGYGVLFVCLDTSIKANEVDAVAQGILDWHKELEPETDTHVFFRDSAFADDIAKTNIVAILEQNGIHHVRSL